MPAQAQAQYSPNCRLNGRALCCALTPQGGSSASEPEAITVVFGDHRVYRLQQRSGSCRSEGMASRCAATLTPDNGMGRPINGVYEGDGYEGGYRHRWRGGGVSIEYVYLD